MQVDQDLGDGVEEAAAQFGQMLHDSLRNVGEPRHADLEVTDGKISFPRVRPLVKLWGLHVLRCSTFGFPSQLATILLTLSTNWS
jgi:hypothetical protein